MRLAAALFLLAAPAAAQQASTAPPVGRIASVFLSEKLINEVIHENLNVPALPEFELRLSPAKDQIEARGLLKIPVDQLKAVNLEPGMGDFRFQLAIRPKVTKEGHLILVFPLDQTFFYPASAADPEMERIVVPVQLLSLALASARGYLAVLSGDFSGFDRKTKELKDLLAAIDKRAAAAKDPEEIEDLRHERRGAELELEALPLERRRGERLAKKLEKLMAFVGEKEINFNQELSAHRNALIVRVQMQHLAPYLEGIELGGVRLVKDERDGSGMNFLAIDLDARLARPDAGGVSVSTPAVSRPAPVRPPALVIRLNQDLFESRALLDAEKAEMGARIKDFTLDLREDGIHARGEWRIPLLPPIPFSTVLDLAWISPNVFELRVRDAEVAHIDITALSGLVLEGVKKRLDKTLKGACSFRYIGEEKDGSRALRATMDMAKLIPSFPKLALSGIATKERELLLKAGLP